MVGKTLGHYEILAPLGEGGMGQVYRARDTTLDRDVAIKVLPEDFASDAGRLALFERQPEWELLDELQDARLLERRRVAAHAPRNGLPPVVGKT